MKKYILSILVLVTVILAAVGCSSHSGFGGNPSSVGPVPDPTPTSIPVPTQVSAAYDHNQKMLEASWSWNWDGGTYQNVSYTVIIRDSNDQEFGKIENISDCFCDSSNTDLTFPAGDYNLNVIAVVDGQKSEESETADFNVGLAPAEPIIDNTSVDVLTKHRPTITWKPGNEAPGVTYHISLKDNSGNIVDSCSTETLVWNSSKSIDGAHEFDIYAENIYGKSTTAVYKFTVKFWEGDGTQSKPYIIADAEHLDNVRDYLNTENVYFKQTNDIDLTEYIASNYPDGGWMPIGDYSNTFKGYYDGGNKKISGFTINRTSTDDVGLFGRCQGTLSNIIMYKPMVEGSINVGALSGSAFNGEFNQCCVIDGSVKGVSECGLLVGVCMAHFNECFTSGGSIIALKTAGGLIGFTNNSDNEITNCYSSGVTISCDERSAGLCGESYRADSKITNSYSANTVNCSGSKGAFVYDSSSFINISDCFTTEEGNLKSGCIKASKYSETGYSWDSDIWDLSKDLPTLRWYDNLGY